LGVFIWNSGREEGDETADDDVFIEVAKVDSAGDAAFGEHSDGLLDRCGGDEAVRSRKDDGRRTDSATHVESGVRR